MSKEGSVAPKERVNIIYKTSTGGAMEEMELPLKILMVGDFLGKPDPTSLEERAPINVDKSNFNEVMSKQNLEVTISVPDRLSQEQGAELATTLKFQKLSDFGPESVVNQMPELKALLELRSALNALKGPIQNTRAFKAKIQALLSDPASRERLMKELSMDGGDKDKK